MDWCCVIFLSSYHAPLSTIPLCESIISDEKKYNLKETLSTVKPVYTVENNSVFPYFHPHYFIFLPINNVIVAGQKT